MKTVDYKDDTGRWWRVAVPDDCPEDLYQSGVPIGPPDLDDRLAERGWPEDARARLHNELHARHLFTLRDLFRPGNQLEGAIKAALRTDMQTVQQWYHEVQRR